MRENHDMEMSLKNISKKETLHFAKQTKILTCFAGKYCF